MHRLLKPDGVMFSHCCGRMGEPGVTDKWTRKYIFPGGYIPALSELVTEAEKNQLIVTDVEALRYHYALHAGGMVQPHRTPHQGGDRRPLRRALLPDVAILSGRRRAAFRYGGLVNWQLQYVKRRDAIPMTRDYMYEEERRLRALEDAPEWHLSRAAE
jgi:cyclopropane-fatty-acyl-phospholipid synthase